MRIPSVVRSDTRSRFDTKKPPLRRSLTFHFTIQTTNIEKMQAG